MRVVRFLTTDGRPAFGAVDDDEVTWLPQLADATLESFVSSMRDDQRLGSTDAGLDRGVAALASLQLLSPIAPRQVIGVGTNYRDHVAEMSATAPAVPTANFAKLPISWTSHGADIELPAGAFVDYEGEIAVVIGRPTFQITEAQVDGHLAGLCLANDVSAREVPTTQLLLGKSHPGFCPLGPFLVTPDDLDLDDLSYTVAVNGELRQTATTTSIIHSIRSIVAGFARSLPLHAGDVILTGSPAGVGVARHPPLELHDGDVVEITSPQLGTLRNRFVSASRSDKYPTSPE